MKALQRDSTDFQYNIKSAIEKVLTDYERTDKFLGPQQYMLQQYIAGKITGYRPRGVLMYHEMGTGKTYGFVAMAAILRQPVVAIMAATLVDNMRKTIAGYERHYQVSIASLFRFFSLDAYNVFEKLQEYLGDDGTLNGHTIIIDEAHEFFGKVLNADNKNAPRLYHEIIRTTSATILLGSGTPIWKDPAELVPCFNMLSGGALFPEDYDEFYNIFIDRGFREIVADADLDAPGKHQSARALLDPAASKHALRMGIMNGHLLQNRIFGFVSHIPRNPSLFPAKRPTIVERIPMDLQSQWVVYRQARVDELNEAARASKFRGHREKGAPGIGRKRGKSSTTYRQKSRALCNAFNDKKSGTIISPKMDKIIENIEKSEGKGIVYSQFREHGIYVLADKLIAAGWTELFPQSRTRAISLVAPGDVEMPEAEEDEEGNETGVAGDEEEEQIANMSLDGTESNITPIAPGINKFSKTFAILDGDTPQELRTKIIEVYNARDNMFGQNLRMLLGTTILTRGISLRCGLHAHVIEPYWYYTQIAQFETRISRFLSHQDMPPEMRYTQTYIYLSTLPEQPADKASMREDLDDWEETETTDETLYYRSLARQYVLDEFLELFKEVAIECPLLSSIVPEADHSAIKCRVCNPTHQKLFSRSIFSDVDDIDPCQPVSLKKISVKKIKINGSEYHYTQEGADALRSVFKMVIYRYNPELKSFVRMAEDDETFLKVYDAIIAGQ